MSEPELKRPVIFAGENPMILLYAPGSNDIVAAATYWRCVYSPEGEGNALIIWVDPAVSGRGDRAPCGLYADNVTMALMVWTNFTQHFGPFQGRGIEDRMPQATRFFQVAEGRRQHRVTCAVGPSVIELLWQDAFDAFQTVTTPVVEGKAYEVASVVLPCARASITIDGHTVPGEVHHPEGFFQSSAFLAFCESWVELKESALKSQD
ncbi:MAG: hypothetical protein M3N47_04475 [Chloroflexota bacterium]|nr:hypothetical protein [Chloroflexota bacterium]